MRPLRILHVVPALGQGGAERLLVALAGQNKEGEHHIVAVMQKGQFFEGGTFEIMDLGFDLSSPLASLGRLLSAVAQLRTLIKDHQIDVVQGWLYYGNLLTLGLAASRKPLIWSIHNSTLPGMFRKPILGISKWLLMQKSDSLPSAIVYCAQDARAVHEHQGYASAIGRVIPNGVDMDRFTPTAPSRSLLRAALGLADEGFIIGLFGRYDPQKNIPGCLEAFSIFAGSHPNARLVMAGNGMDAANAELAAEIVRHGVAGRVKCLGPLTNMADAYHAVDLVMLGSAYGEAMPLVLLEALACYTPIASTILGDIGTLPVPARALVPVGDMAALAAAMSSIAASQHPDPEWEQCYATVRETYGIERYFAAHSQLYRELTRQSSVELAAHG